MVCCVPAMSATPRIISTFRNRDRTWRSRVKVIDRSTMSGTSLLRALVASSSGCDAMVPNGSVGV